MTLNNYQDILQYIDLLLKHNSFTKAAKDLYISQPYLTQIIKKIEDDLGTEIINRKSPQLQLTEAGKVYYQYLENSEAELNQLKNTLIQYNEDSPISLSIGVLSSLATFILPITLPKFVQAHPEVTLTILEDLPSNSEAKAMSQEIDFYIGQNPETVSPSLITHLCGTHRYYAVIPPSSDLYVSGSVQLSPNTIAIDKLLSQDLVLTSSGSAIRRQINRLLKRYNITPNIVLESTNIYTVSKFAEHGTGVAFIPESAVPTLQEDLEYNLYPISLDLMSVDFFIAYFSQFYLTDLHHDFLNRFITIVQTHLIV